MVWLPHWPKVGESLSIKLGLERIQSLLSALDNPEKKMPPTIHIAGTNGKGSTTAFTKSILEQAGLKVHVYTSPHLERFNERIVLAGEEITDEYLFRILEECRVVSEKNNIQVSFFEGITAAAFLAFSRVKADVVILETGLGGRLDATNVLKNPLVTIITPISYDHTNVLGETLAKIATEKCGIMRKNISCIVSMQPEEAKKAIIEYAENLKTPLTMFEYDYGVFLENNMMRYSSKDFDIIIRPPSLLGDHQFINAAGAIAAIRSVYGDKIDKKIIESGISKSVWKGRLQRIAHGRLKNKLNENWEIWLDCAHNDAGAQAFGNWLNKQPKMPTYLIFSMTRNRNVNSFLSHMNSTFEKIICSDIHSEPLAYKGADILGLIDDKKLREICETVTSVEAGVDLILSQNHNEPKKRIIVTGSMYLVSDFLIANKN